MTDTLVEERSSYNVLLQHEATLSSVEQEIDQTIKVIESVGQHGVDASTLPLLGIQRFLSQASLDAIATESLSSRVSLDNLALEALTETVSEKSAAWAAKVVHTLKEAGKTLLAIISPVANRLIEMANELKIKLQHKAFDATQEVKAHPYKTVMALIAAGTAVFGILAIAGTRLPGGETSREGFLAFFRGLANMVSNISWPFGKIETAVSTTGSVTIPVVPKVKPTVQTAQNLGWTGPTVNEFCNGSTKLAQSSLRTAISFGWNAAKFVGKAVPKTFAFGNRFRRVAPVAVHKITRSKTLAHASFIGLTVLFYGFCIKAFVFACRAAYEIGCFVMLVLKSTCAIFM